MIAIREPECCALARTDCRPTPLRRRAGRPQLKRDPLGGARPQGECRLDDRGQSCIFDCMILRAWSRLLLAILTASTSILTILRRLGSSPTSDPAIVRSLSEYPDSPHVEVQRAGLILHVESQAAVGPSSTRDAPLLRAPSQPPYFMYDDTNAITYQVIAANYDHMRRSVVPALAASK